MLLGFGEGAAFRVGFKAWVGLGVSDGCRVVFIGEHDGVWGGGSGVGWASRVGFVMGVRGGFIGWIYRGC